VNDRLLIPFRSCLLLSHFSGDGVTLNTAALQKTIDATKKTAGIISLFYSVACNYFISTA
jgi:hypothetical protein